MTTLWLWTFWLRDAMYSHHMHSDPTASFLMASKFFPRSFFNPWTPRPVDSIGSLERLGPPLYLLGHFWQALLDYSWITLVPCSRDSSPIWHHNTIVCDRQLPIMLDPFESPCRLPPPFPGPGCKCVNKDIHLPPDQVDNGVL